MRSDGVAGRVLTEYDPNAKPPALAMVDHGKVSSLSLIFKLYHPIR